MSHPHGAIPDPRLILNQMEIPEYPGIFVLGTYEKNVSILAQQIRAINLVLSLESEGRLLAQADAALPPDRRNRKYKDIVVVGNGIAGRTAAAMFSRCHCNVTIVGPEDNYLRANPAHSSRRFIHPFISDFPFSEFPKIVPDSAALPVMDWKAGNAHAVYNTLNGAWEGLLKGYGEYGRLTPVTARADEVLPTAGGRFIVLLDSSEILNAEIVILAVGIGDLPKGANYWDTNTQSLQEQASGGKVWLLSGMGDSNITEFITLVYSPELQASAYEQVVHELVKCFSDTNAGKLLLWCRQVEFACQYMRPDQASLRLKEQYAEVVKRSSDYPGLTNLLEGCKKRLRAAGHLPKIILNSTTPTVYSRDAFPLNRLALAITLSALGDDFGEGKLVSYVSGEAEHDQDGTPYITPKPVVRPAASVIAIGNKWLACNHFNPRRAPKSSLWQLLLDKQPVDARAKEELKPRNGLDQTRHRMWPYHGNLKRILSSRSPDKVSALSLSDCPSGHASPLIVSMTYTASESSVVIDMCYVPAFPGLEGAERPFAGYWIGRYPITREQWSNGMQAGNPEGNTLSDPNNSQDSQLPVTNTSWLEALDFCMKYGISLPTEVQWRAAWQWPGEWSKPKPPRAFPWGDFGVKWRDEAGRTDLASSPFVVSNLFDRNRAASHGGRYGVCKVDSHGDADGPWGTSQQFGNVLEWCLNGGRPLGDYFSLTLSDARGSVPASGSAHAARLRPLGGVSALETDEVVMKQWPDFTWAHDETRRPDVGFRVVWIGSLSGCGGEGPEIDKMAAERDRWWGAIPKKTLLTLESRRDAQVDVFSKLKNADIQRPYFSTLVKIVQENRVKRVRIVLGTANKGASSGHRLEQALAYDALGIDLFIAWFKENYKIDAEIVLAHEETVKPLPQEDLTILIGSGRTNPATHRCLEKLAIEKKLPGFTFLHPEGNVLCDGQGVSYAPELGMLAVVPCPAGGDGLVVISAGVGREGTAAANHALAAVFGAKKPAVPIGGWQAINQADCDSVVVQATIASRHDRISQVDVHQCIPEHLQAKAPPARPEEPSSM